MTTLYARKSPMPAKVLPVRSPLQIQTDFPTFLARYASTLKSVFDERAERMRVHISRGFPPFLLREIQACVPLSVFIPQAFGGRGEKVHECLAVLAASSYESLALSLTVGINGALFLQPLSKYGQEEIKAPIFERFIRHQNMGGLMITEPDYGSDALSMQTSFTETEDRYLIQGTKHWGGLTGQADFWLVTARGRTESGQLARDIDFFVADVHKPEQMIEVEELYHNLGLYMIPYGRNEVDIRVPKTHRLVPHSTGLKMMLDVLHRSRIQFPGMAMGFLQRILDEALTHAQERMVGGKSLLSYDQVQQRIAQLQAYFTACSAMCAFTSERAALANDLSKEGIPANAVKSVVTDLMQDASQSLLQLVGAKGYRLDHIAGRAIVDSRPFQIFEGSNDILYQQLAEAVVKLMRRNKETNLYAYLRSYELTDRAAEYFKTTVDFTLDATLPQRKLVDLGKILGRIMTMNFVLELGDRGFHRDLIEGCLQQFTQEVRGHLSVFRSEFGTSVAEDYTERSSWLAFVNTQPA
jgi:alkylation response protein AidB-like acyl-CoA dehydrogenase